MVEVWRLWSGVERSGYMYLMMDFAIVFFVVG
jgi:hypothetical protein